MIIVDSLTVGSVEYFYCLNGAVFTYDTPSGLIRMLIDNWPATVIDQRLIKMVLRYRSR
jgi:hypothetical protein